MAAATHYQILGVARDAEDIVIRAAYKAMIIKYHPDKFTGGDAQAERMAKAINEAYAVIGDQQKRAEYDADFERDFVETPGSGEPTHSPSDGLIRAEPAAPTSATDFQFTRTDAAENKISRVALALVFISALAWLGSSLAQDDSSTVVSATPKVSEIQTEVPPPTEPVIAKTAPPTAPASPAETSIDSVEVAAAAVDGPSAAYSSNYKQCISTGDALNGVTAAIMDCNGEEIDRQDSRLNQVYALTMASLVPVERARLRDAERSWVVQRDADCHRKESAEEGGTLASIIYSGCILEETTKRAEWLQQYRP